MKATVKGGIHPICGKNALKLVTRDEAIRDYAAESVVIPMAMQLGAPSVPCVEVGDYVKRYQVIAKGQGALGLDVHASVSGEVIEIAEKQQLSGHPVCITIKNDFEDACCELEEPCGLNAEPKKIIEAIKNAGICGMGGAAFPAHVKLMLKENQHCELMIINGAECETSVTADDRLMREKPEKILSGLKAAMRAAGADKGVVAIEDNKAEAIASMKAAAEGSGIEIRILRTKYPQGGEKQLIKAVTGREVKHGGLPIDSGVIVLNVGTASAISDAVEKGIPFTERVTTVTGAVRQPSNLRLRVGTLISDAVSACGGYTCPEPSKIVCGGAMMGMAAPSDNISLIKASNAIIVMDEKDADLPNESACIRCGKCVDACPMGLLPYLMKRCAEKNDIEGAQKLNVADCILCGSCTYICPAKRYLSASFKHMKDMIAQNRRK